MTNESLDWLESAEGPRSASSEDREKAQERARQATAGIQKTQKDEWKQAKTSQLLVTAFLQMLRDDRYDSVFPVLNTLLAQEVPTHIIAGLASLIYVPISDIIRRDYYVPSREGIAFTWMSLEPTKFDKNDLPEPVRERVNAWVEDILAVVSHAPSQLITARFLQDIHSSESPLKDDIIRASSQLLIYFFASVQIETSEEDALLYANFIIESMIARMQSWFTQEGDIDFVGTQGSVEVM